MLGRGALLVISWVQSGREARPRQKNSMEKPIARQHAATHGLSRSPVSSTGEERELRTKVCLLVLLRAGESVGRAKLGLAPILAIFQNTPVNLWRGDKRKRKEGCQTSVFLPGPRVFGNTRAPGWRTPSFGSAASASSF